MVSSLIVHISELLMQTLLLCTGYLTIFADVIIREEKQTAEDGSFKLSFHCCFYPGPKMIFSRLKFFTLASNPKTERQNNVMKSIMIRNEKIQFMP